jgi:hypothetical protein
MDYYEVLGSARFRSLVEQKKLQCKNKCEVCGETKPLQAHHLSYDNLGNESPSEILMVCDSCHCICHNKYDGHRFAVKFNDKWIFHPNLESIIHLGAPQRIDKIPIQEKIYLTNGSKLANRDYKKVKKAREKTLGSKKAWGMLSKKQKEQIADSLKITVNELSLRFLVDFSFVVVERIREALKKKIHHQKSPKRHNKPKPRKTHLL